MRGARWLGFLSALSVLTLLPERGTVGDDGLVAIFDGKTLDGWEQKGGKAWYTVEDGAIVGRSVPGTPNSFLCTEKLYEDFILEYEFLCSDGLNSGVQIRSRCYDEPATWERGGKKGKIAAGRVHGYQVEIDPNNPNRMWTAGVYDEGRRGWLFPGSSGGDAKAFSEQGKRLYRKGEWNKVRVEARGPRFCTWLNGELRADFSDDMTPSGFIGLQVHGVGGRKDPLEVRWRNLRIRELPHAGSGKGAWRPLWNGKTLEGWTATPGGEWTVETVEGKPALVGRSKSSDPRHGILLTEERFRDFTVRVKYKILKGNSGLYFRVDRVESAVAVHGFQAEMAEKGDAGGLYETGGRAWVVKPSAEDSQKCFKPYEWNDMTVSAHGGHVTVEVNGIQTAELTDDPGRKEGHIGIQLHGGQDMHVIIRDIEIRTAGH